MSSNILYNIASRATQSNSVYESVPKIPIVHADSVSKLLRQNFFFARAEEYYISTIMDNNRDSANEDNFATFSFGLGFLSEAENEKNNENFA